MSNPQSKLLDLMNAIDALENAPFPQKIAAAKVVGAAQKNWALDIERRIANLEKEGKSNG